MVQLSVVPPDPEDAARPTVPVGTRERNRLTRHRTYVQSALHIVCAEGLAALTMQRLAAEVGASVGSVYTYFPSKGALVAEVQREAIERLATSAARLGDAIDASEATTGPLAALVGFGRFWLTAGNTFPEEMQLLMLLLSDVTEQIPVDDAARVVPAALRLLGLAEARIADAAERELLSSADAAQRTIALAASLTGCLQLAVISHWDTELLDPVANGRRVLDGLLLAWGANADDVAAANRAVDAVEAAGPLARPVPSPATKDDR